MRAAVRVDGQSPTPGHGPGTTVVRGAAWGELAEDDEEEKEQLQAPVGPGMHAESPAKDASPAEDAVLLDDGHTVASVTVDEKAGVMRVQGRRDSLRSL